MTGLVDYPSSSDDDDNDERHEAVPPAEKQRVSDLPPLPATFLDQYSSTVRTSVRDDASLHSGRQRVTPHVEGRWPTHVYLDWHPDAAESRLFSDVVAAARQRLNLDGDFHGEDRAMAVHSLLENELGVSLPLHVSLSRPLSLPTDQKEAYVARLGEAIRTSQVQFFEVQPAEVLWHANESRTRNFLVARVRCASGRSLERLLTACNAVATEFFQPRLYSDGDEAAGARDEFHMSVAWSLGSASLHGARQESATLESQPIVPPALMAHVAALSIQFSEVKVRVGQAVQTIPLGPPRVAGSRY